MGSGPVELVQIPVPDETNGNIVAVLGSGQVRPAEAAADLEYRFLWQKDPETRPPLSWVAQTRRGRGYTRNPDGSIGVRHRLRGPALKKLPADVKVEAAVSVDANGELLQHNAYRNDDHRRLARNAAPASPRRRQTGRAARQPACRQQHTVRDMELHSYPRIESASG